MAFITRIPKSSFFWNPRTKISVFPNFENLHISASTTVMCTYIPLIEVLPSHQLSIYQGSEYSNCLMFIFVHKSNTIRWWFWILIVSEDLYKNIFVVYTHSSILISHSKFCIPNSRINKNFIWSQFEDISKHFIPLKFKSFSSNNNICILQLQVRYIPILLSRSLKGTLFCSRVSSQLSTTMIFDEVNLCWFYIWWQFMYFS